MGQVHGYRPKASDGDILRCRKAEVNGSTWLSIDSSGEADPFHEQVIVRVFPDRGWVI